MIVFETFGRAVIVSIAQKQKNVAHLSALTSLPSAARNGTRNIRLAMSVAASAVSGITQMFGEMRLIKPLKK